VDHELQVRFVEAHPKGRGGDKRLDPVVDQRLFSLEAIVRISLTGVRQHVMASLTQMSGDLDSRGNGEGVDNARTGPVVQMVGKPRQLVPRIRQVQYT
jgi:hypothetical protein